MLSSQPAIEKPQAILVVYWRERQCNIVIDTEKDRRGIQEIIDRGKRQIRKMIYDEIHEERSQLRRPN